MAAQPAMADAGDDLDVSVVLAPVAPDGLTAGAVTDFIVELVDTDPVVGGIGLQAGGTIRIVLPPEFVNHGELPVLGTGEIPGCGPPLVATCSTAVVLQGWPQSVQPPFPAVTWEPATNTIALTTKADWLPAGPHAPGPKTVHLQLFGFTNPERPGNYDLDIEVQPDPDSGSVLSGRAAAHIARNINPNITSVSLANGTPPPPFPNTLYQTVTAGDPSLTLLLYLWAADRVPLVGASFDDGSARVRLISDAAGHPVGRVKVTIPPGAETGRRPRPDRPSPHRRSFRDMTRRAFGRA